MSIKRMEVGPRMSQAVVHSGVAYLAGQVAQRAPGASVADQTTDILARIDELLAAAGTDKSKLLSATIWLTDMGAFAEMNAVWDAWIDPREPAGPGVRPVPGPGRAAVHRRDHGERRGVSAARASRSGTRRRPAPGIPPMSAHPAAIASRRRSAGCGRRRGPR